MMIFEGSLCALLLMSSYFGFVSNSQEQVIQPTMTLDNYAIFLEGYLKGQEESDEPENNRNGINTWLNTLGPNLDLIADEVYTAHKNLMSTFDVVKDSIFCLEHGPRIFKSVKRVNTSNAPRVRGIIDKLWKQYVSLCVNKARDEFMKKARAIKPDLYEYVKNLAGALDKHSGDQKTPFHDPKSLSDEIMVTDAYHTIIEKYVDDEEVKKITTYDKSPTVEVEVASRVLDRYVTDPCNHLVKALQKLTDKYEEMEEDTEDRKYPDGYLSHARNYIYCTRYLRMSDILKDNFCYEVRQQTGKALKVRQANGFTKVISCLGKLCDKIC